MRNIGVGDTITITDSDDALAGPYRVFGRTIGFEDGQYTAEYEVSNGAKSILKDLEEDTDKGITLSKYMQGATNIYCVSTYENCDATHPLYLRFYFPPDTVALNTAKVSFKLKNFRAYETAVTTVSTTSAAGSAHGHSLDIAASGSHQHTINATTSDQAISEMSVGYLNYNTGWTNHAGSGGWTTVQTSEIMRAGYMGEFVVNAFTTNGGAVGLRFRINNGGTYYPDQYGTYGRTGGNNESMAACIYIASANSGGSSATLEVKPDAGAGLIIYTSTDEMWFTKHTHTIAAQTSASATHTHSGIATNTEASHVHTVPAQTANISFGIYEEALASPSVVVTAGVEGSESAVGTYTTDQADLNISSAIPGIAGNWYVVKFTPNKRMRIEANLYIKMFLHSR
jgi:hypothetical protein